MLRCDIAGTMSRLLAQEDTDNDKRITIDDKGPKRFELKPGDRTMTVTGTYHLSNLLQELTLARESGRDEINPDHIFENPLNRLDRVIREQFWSGLTRCMDEAHLGQILQDPKSPDPDKLILYVPFNDKAAFDFYTPLQKRVGFRLERLPQNVTPRYVKSLNDAFGLLTLAADKNDGSYKPLPFVVPGGRFNELYGWDSYFINRGLLLDGKISLAKNTVDHFLYEIRHYGKILNANRSYYLTRTQPPFLTSMIRELWPHLAPSGESRAWLKNALLTAIYEYKTVWMAPPRLTANGLSRYYGEGIGMPPEPEPGHFDHVFERFARDNGIDPVSLKEDYLAGRIKHRGLDEFFIHDRSLRESGHDNSYRIAGRCANLNTVDLNSLLYKYECDLADMLETHFDGVLENAGKKYEAKYFRQTAEQRSERMQYFMWNEDEARFFDYDFEKDMQTGFESITNLYPLWAGMLTHGQAARVVERGLPLYVEKGGLVSTTEKSRGPLGEGRVAYQWDYPNGWAPHQMLIWQGLRKYGYESEASDLAYRWLHTIVRNAADYNGTVPEKYDVVACSHKVFAEYGNVGTDFSYITREGFGWMNASFKEGLSLLDAGQKKKLRHIGLPE